MLKMYHTQAHSGSSPDFWDENWEASQFEETVRFCAVDPLRPLFEKYLRQDSLMLEGGCGLGNYLAYYSARGFNVVGLDFAQRALKTLRIRQPGLKLCGGDVSRLPFADKTFDLYYSGGVVEHFESGAEQSLKEAQRVLKDDGVLLISVPYYNPLRRILTSFRTDDWRRVEKCEIESETVVPGKCFFQYAYRPAEFQRMLEDADLKVVEKQGYAVIWGLSDVPFLRGSDGGFSAQTSNGPRSKPVEVNVEDLILDRKTSMLKRLAVIEDSSVPVLGLAVKLMRWSVANMMMYVCRRK